MTLGPRDWPPPWRPVDHGEGPGLEATFHALAGAGHPLHAAQAMAVAVRLDAPVALFVLFGAPAALAEVRLDAGPEGCTAFADWPSWLASHALRASEG